MQKMISNAQDLVQQKQMFINSDTLTDAKLNNTSLYVLFVEQVCCKKQQKKVPDQLLVCGTGDL